MALSFGISPALVTPFAGGGVDVNRLARHTQDCLDRGCRTATVFGTTGEGPSVGAAERERVSQALIGSSIPAARLVEGVIASSIEEAAFSTGQALRRGAHAILLAPPFYFRPVPDEAVLAWFTAVFKAVGPGLRDIILYHIPGMTGVPLTHGVIGDLVKAFPGAVRGVKDSAADAAATFALIEAFPDLEILVGDETYLGRACAAGGAGSICGLANMVPEAVIALSENGRDDPRVVEPGAGDLEAFGDSDGEGARGVSAPGPGVGFRAPASADHRRGDGSAGRQAPFAVREKGGGHRVSVASHAPRASPRTAVKLRERAYDAFTHHLLQSDIKPGQLVSQRELVALTGQPLGAIRELIPRLEAEGLIVTVPQRGLQIPPLDPGLIRNAFQFRLILEREAVAAFVETASDAKIEREEAAHRDIVSLARRGVTDELVARAQQVDREFHEAVIDELDNDIISKAYRVNWIKVRLIRQSETNLNEDLVVPVMREHLAIIAAMKARDSAAAVGAASTHILNARSRALRLM